MPRRTESPDPLALEASSEECISAAPPETPIAGPSRSRAKSTSTSARAKRIAQSVVELETPSKKRKTAATAGNTENDEVANGKRTPLARASPATNRASATKVVVPPRKGKEVASATTVLYDESILLPGRTKATPRSTPKHYPSQLLTPTSSTPKPTTPTRPAPNASTPSKGPPKRTPTKIATPKPPALKFPSPKKSVSRQTPAKRRKTTPPPVIELDLLEIPDEPVEDEVEGDEYVDEAVSRETFLTNEKLRRQREARNFKYTGSADAPKLTRSGKVIGDKEQEVDYTQSPQPQVGSRREAGLGDRTVEVFKPPVKVAAEELFPLPPGAKPYVRKMLDNLTGRNIAVDPLPFAEEDKNEALNGLVNLLKGTVERGEGNSALIVGARGVGKTRVSETRTTDQTRSSQTIARALSLLPSTSANSPIIVRLSGLAQTNDRLAIREMGRQIAEAEGKFIAAEEEEEEAGEDAVSRVSASSGELIYRNMP